MTIEIKTRTTTVKNNVGHTYTFIQSRKDLPVFSGCLCGLDADIVNLCLIGNDLEVGRKFDFKHYESVPPAHQWLTNDVDDLNIFEVVNVEWDTF